MGIIALSSCSIELNKLLLQSLFKLYNLGSQHFSNAQRLKKNLHFAYPLQPYLTFNKHVLVSRAKGWPAFYPNKVLCTPMLRTPALYNSSNSLLLQII